LRSQTVSAALDPATRSFGGNLVALIRNTNGAVLLYVAKESSTPTVTEIRDCVAKSKHASKLTHCAFKAWRLHEFMAEAIGLGMNPGPVVPGWPAAQPSMAVSFHARRDGVLPSPEPSNTIVDVYSPRPAETVPLYKSPPGELHVYAIDMFDVPESIKVDPPGDWHEFGEAT